MKVRHYKKWYSRDNMPECASDELIFLYSVGTDSFCPQWLSELSDEETRPFVLMDEFQDIPDQHPYFVLETNGWNSKMTSVLSATLGSGASCYDDFVADPAMGFFIARTNTKRKWYHFLFRTEEDRMLARLVIPPHFLRIFW